jgi:uncharacterized membrane protein
VKLLEITINAKQLIAAIWTIIAIVVSVVMVVSFWHDYDGPWYLHVAIFFGLMLLITLPVYLLLALWEALRKPE